MIKTAAKSRLLFFFAVSLSLVHGSLHKKSVVYHHKNLTLQKKGGGRRSPFENHAAFVSSNILQLRGGAKVSAVKTRKHESEQGATAVSVESKNKALQVTIWSVVVASISYVVWENRATLIRLFNKQKLQDSVLRVLQRIQEGGTTKGLCIYVAGMAVWEFLGMSTIPVETAAGMAFGYQPALLASAGGKLLGAVLAFWVGRLFLSDWVEMKLADNTVMQLVEGSVESHPLRTALLFKFSCFPEFVKNFGTSVLTPIEPWMFVFSTIVHGWPYSALWTFLGADTVARMQDESLPANLFLQVLLVLAAIIGIVGSPTLMAWWVRDLKQQSQINTDTQKRN